MLYYFYNRQALVPQSWLEQVEGWGRGRRRVRHLQLQHGRLGRDDGRHGRNGRHGRYGRHGRNGWHGRHGMLINPFIVMDFFLFFSSSFALFLHGLTCCRTLVMMRKVTVTQKVCNPWFSIFPTLVSSLSILFSFIFFLLFFLISFPDLPGLETDKKDEEEENKPAKEQVD